MARTPYALGRKASTNSSSGVVGVTLSRTSKGHPQWNAWGVKDGRTLRLYSGPSFDEACDARSQWEQQVKK